MTCCPFRALRGLRNFGLFKNEGKKPVFAFATGRLLTIATFNKTLRLLLSQHLGAISVEYSSHSFRAAISSALAKYPFLASENEIKCWGRWDSSAFKKYTRLKLAQRHALHVKVAKALIYRAPERDGQRGPE